MERDALEPDLRIDLAVALSATAGYTAPAWENNSARLLELHERTGGIAKLFPVLWGQWVGTFSAGKIAPARALPERMLQIAERQGERAFVMVGHRVLGMSLVGEGLDLHIPKGYIYFAMGFSVFVEMINLRVRGTREPVQLHRLMETEELRN